MQLIHTIEAQRALSQQWRQQKLSIALVPTMGNLHAGHLSLVAKAKTLADVTIVSIFVNPLQFAPNEDFASYPRTLTNDREQLAALAVDGIFVPSANEMYGEDKTATAFVKVPVLSDDLCGKTRPQHFQGVTTVVAKLLNIVQPHVAIFGEKDFQQLLLIKKMVHDLNFPVTIHGMPIVRETDGLAMSSRNQYLTAEERWRATGLQRSLLAARAKIAAGYADLRQLEQETQATLQALGFRPDYVAIRRADNLQPAVVGDTAIIILAAAFLGKTRLLDNVRV